MRNVLLMSLALTCVSTPKLLSQDSTAVRSEQPLGGEDWSSAPLRFVPQSAFGATLTG